MEDAKRTRAQRLLTAIGEEEVNKEDDLDERWFNRIVCESFRRLIMVDRNRRVFDQKIHATNKHLPRNFIFSNGHF